MSPDCNDGCYNRQIETRSTLLTDGKGIVEHVHYSALKFVDQDFLISSKISLGVKTSMNRESAAPHIEILDLALSSRNKFMYYLIINRCILGR